MNTCVNTKLIRDTNCLYLHLTHLVVFSIIPAPTVFCWDTIIPTELEARVTFTSFLAASTGATYIPNGAHLGAATGTRVIVAILTTMKCWKQDRSIMDELAFPQHSIFQFEGGVKVKTTYDRMSNSSIKVEQLQPPDRYQHSPGMSHRLLLGHHEQNTCQQHRP